MKDYKITTNDNGGTMVFVTKGVNIKGALRRLINHSYDFKMINQKKIKITVECLTKESK